MQTLLLIAISQRLQNSALILGIIGIISGLLLLRGHQTAYQQSLQHPGNAAAKNFENRKMKRRSLVAALVTSVGCLLSAIYWVSELRVLAIFTLLIVVQVLMILAIAIVDMFSVGMRMATQTQTKTQRQMIEEFLREREKAADRDQNSTTPKP